MNFPKLRINSNNFYYEKCLDLLIQNEPANNEAYNMDSSCYNRIIKNTVDLNLTSYNPQNILELYSMNNSYQLEYTRPSPIPDNDNQLLDYGKQLNSLINLNNNFLIKKKKRPKKNRNIKRNPKHTKFSSDNLQRKCKNLVLAYILEYVNYQIQKIYEGNIGNGIHIKKLLDINQEQKAPNTLNHLKSFKNKTIKEIFSTVISKRYTSYLPNHNEIIINRILTEKDENKRKKFNKIFNLTFSDCIQIFLGNNISEDYEGFPNFDNIKYKLKGTKEYINKIKEFLYKIGA